MNDCRAILKKAGAVLVAVGAIDLAFWIYFMSGNLSYRSNFNIPAVAAGIFLMRGSLKAAHLITWFSALMLGFIGANLLLMPFLKPAGLWVAVFKLKLFATVMSLAIAVFSAVFLAWIYLQLRSAPILSALRSAGHPTKWPKFAFAIGIAVVIFSTATLLFIANGDAAAKAIELARAKYGEQYQYYPTGIRWSGDRTSATLAAYSNRHLASVVVEWEQ
jgi:hypothetical protein